MHFMIPVDLNESTWERSQVVQPDKSLRKMPITSRLKRRRLSFNYPLETSSVSSKLPSEKSKRQSRNKTGLSFCWIWNSFYVFHLILHGSKLFWRRRGEGINTSLFIVISVLLLQNSFFQEMKISVHVFFLGGGGRGDFRKWKGNKCMNLQWFPWSSQLTVVAMTEAATPWVASRKYPPNSPVKNIIRLEGTGKDNSKDLCWRLPGQISTFRCWEQNSKWKSGKVMYHGIFENVLSFPLCQ